MIPKREDYPIIKELEDLSHKLAKEPASAYLADLLQRAADEIFSGHYEAWQYAMGDDL